MRSRDASALHVPDLFRSFYCGNSSYEVKIYNMTFYARKNAKVTLRTWVGFIQEVDIVRFDDKPELYSISATTVDGRTRLIVEDTLYGEAQSCVEEIYQRLEWLWNRR